MYSAWEYVMVIAQRIPGDKRGSLLFAGTALQAARAAGTYSWHQARTEQNVRMGTIEAVRCEVQDRRDQERGRCGCRWRHGRPRRGTIGHGRKRGCRCSGRNSGGPAGAAAEEG
jgi:outer membrane lipoprotein SlyB